MIKNGMIRIATGVGVGLFLFESASAVPLAYIGVLLALALGVLLILGRPAALLSSAPNRLVVDLAAITLVVVGGADRTFILLYFLAAFGIVWSETRLVATLAGAVSFAAYLVAVWSTGEIVSVMALLGVAMFGAFCLLAWGLSGETRALRESAREAHRELATERGYSGSVSELASSFGPALEVLDLKGILGWTSQTARELTRSSFAHVVLLDGNQHATSANGGLDRYPTWWHPTVQELVLRGSRHDGALSEADKSANDLRGFMAVRLEIPGSEHNGTLLVGGREFQARDERVLKLLSKQASSALANSWEAPGGRDAITGLPNRTSLYRVLEGEFRQGTSSTVFSVRVGGLWSYENGRETAFGESVLKDIGVALGEHQRAFRYGMDEVFILLRGTNQRRAERVSAWIKETVSEVSRGSSSYISASVGYVFADPRETEYRAAIFEARRYSNWSDRRPVGSYDDVETDDVPESEDSVVAALLEAASIRDYGLGWHLRSVRRMARIIGEEMGLDEARMQTLSLGALLHDIGKIGIPDAVLKKPGRLTDEEFDLVKRHTVMGAGVLAQVPHLADAVPVIRHHHERYDGRGYPDGLTGTDIPLASRIVFVADAYDSMVQDRPYRKGLSHEEALQEIRDNSGSQFDPEVASAFLRRMEDSDGRRRRRDSFAG